MKLSKHKVETCGSYGLSNLVYRQYPHDAPHFLTMGFANVLNMKNHMKHGKFYLHSPRICKWFRCIYPIGRNQIASEYIHVS